MKISTIGWFISSAVLTCSSAVGIAACSSSSGDDSSTGTDASGSDTSTDGGTGTDSNTATDSSTDGGASTCGPSLHTSSASTGVFCPFSKDFSSDSGTYAYCTTGTQSCCLSPASDAGVSVCATTGSCAAKFKQWECAGPEDCTNPANPVCCLQAGATEANTECSGTLKTKGFDQTYCTTATACVGTFDAGSGFTDDNFVACEADSDCPSGKSCVAIETTGTDIGICQ